MSDEKLDTGDVDTEDLDEDLDVDEDALEEEDLAEDDEVLVDDVLDDAEELLDEGAAVEVAVGGAADVVVAPTGDEEDEEALDLDEELHPDDVEAPLDALLQEKTAAATMADEEEALEDEEADADEPGEGPTRIVPRRADEFQCESCFLVLPRTQLADEARMLCRDCV